MVKTIGKGILLIIVSAIGYLGYLWFTQPALIAPLPYQIETDYGEEIDMAEGANVLIVGDRLGKSLERYQDTLVKKLSAKLKDPLRVYNWARENEGLNRTLHKLKSLRKFPEVILYLGGSEEFYEERFHINDREKILENVKKFKDEHIASVIYTLPVLSRFIYSPVKFYKLTSEIQKDPGDFTSKYQQDKMEVSFNLFDTELEELISLVKEKGSYLVLSTSPVNLLIPPKKVCANSSTETLEEYQRELGARLEKGQHKILVKELRKLAQTTIGNASSFYLLGQAALGSGLFDEAKAAFIKAAAFDCGNWRSHPVFNSIIKKKVTDAGIKLIDFDNIVNRHMGTNELFLGEHFPQELYYEHYMDEVHDTIKLKLDL